MSSYKRFITNYNNNHKFMIDYKAGDIVNNLEIVEYVGYTCKPNGSHPIHYYRVKCLSCGNIFITTERYIKWFGDHGCICHDNEKRTSEWYANLLSNTKLYSIWYNMYQKCNNPNHPEYYKHGACGITICSEWSGKDGFLNFFNWALYAGYNSNNYVSLRRIDLTKEFSPDNCILSSSIESYNNKNNNNEVIWGNLTYTVTELCNHFGLDRSRVFDRLYYGKSIEEAVLMPKTRTGVAGKHDRIEFMNSHPLIVDGDRIVQNPNAVNPFVSTRYPEIDTNDPQLNYHSEEELAAIRGLTMAPQETEEEYQKAREAARQALINKLYRGNNDE